MLNSEMPLSSAKKKSEKARKFEQNGVKQAENQWKCPNLGIKKSDFRLKSQNWHLCTTEKKYWRCEIHYIQQVSKFPGQGMN